MKRGRRWAMLEVEGAWWWSAWRLFERVEGIAGSESDARAAIDHFLSSPMTYRQAAR